MTNPTPDAQQPSNSSLPSYGPPPAQPPYGGAPQYGAPGQPGAAPYAGAEAQYPATAQYGAPQYPAYGAPARKTNGLAIATLVLGILGFAIIPVILGHVSLSQIKKRGEEGKVMAIIGLVLGYIGVAVWIFAIIAMIVSLGIAASYSSYY